MAITKRSGIGEALITQPAGLRCNMERQTVQPTTRFNSNPCHGTQLQGVKVALTQAPTMVGWRSRRSCQCVSGIGEITRTTTWTTGWDRVVLRVHVVIVVVVA
jgi:hypothetical protein